jgi:hypothetical protein
MNPFDRLAFDASHAIRLAEARPETMKGSSDEQEENSYDRCK